MTYTGPWEQQLIDFHFYPPHNRLTQTPANLDDIKAKLSCRRLSLDQPRFSDDDYSKFKKNNDDVESKSAAQTLVFSTLVGDLDIPHEQNMTFSNLKPLTDDSIPMPRPTKWHRVCSGKREGSSPKSCTPANITMSGRNPNFSPAIPSLGLPRGEKALQSPPIRRLRL